MSGAVLGEHGACMESVSGTKPDRTDGMALQSVTIRATNPVQRVCTLIYGR